MGNVNRTAIGVIGVILMAQSAHAGAGANMNVCINLATKPPTPMSVSISVAGSGTHCMNDTGQSGSFSAGAVGLNCASVGYVEEKGSSTKGDTCATDTSTWPVSYSITGQSFSGSAQVHMSRGTTANQVNITGQSPNTVICNSAAVCVNTSTSWDHDTQGPLYIIFQPEATGN